MKDPIGIDCFLDKLSDGRYYVHGNWRNLHAGVKENGKFFGGVRFLVEQSENSQIVRGIRRRTNIPVNVEIATPVLTDFYFFVWFGYEYKSQSGGIPDTVYTEVNNDNKTIYLASAGFGHPDGGAQFLEVDTGDGIYWDWHLTRIHLHGIASAKPSGWVPTDPLGPAPWYNASGNYEVSFDVYQWTTYPDLSDERTFVETVTTTIAVNPAATNTPGTFITDEYDLPYDASYGSTALDRTWTYSDTLIPDPGGSGTRISYEFENLRFAPV